MQVTWYFSVHQGQDTWKWTGKTETKVQKEEAKSLSLQSLMQGDSSSQYPKNAGRGVLLKLFSQMKWKEEAPDLMLLKII